jgi:hypothetical protein
MKLVHLSIVKTLQPSSENKRTGKSCLERKVPPDLIMLQAHQYRRDHESNEASAD